MRKLVLAVLALGFATGAMAQGSHYVRGYTRSNGTYVAPHYQTNPNSTTLDNWSTRGNVNPYTGQAGTRNPYSSGSTYGGYGSSTYGSSSSYGSQSDDGSCC